MTNIEIVFSDWVDALRRGDIERMRARLSPDAVHQGIRPQLRCGNADEIIGQISRRRGVLSSVEIFELVAAGDHVVLSVRAPGVGAPLDDSDTPRGQSCIVFTLSNGRIVRMQDYVNRDDALRAADAAVEWD